MCLIKRLYLITIFNRILKPTMIIVHIVEPFATGIAMFIKSLTESMPDDMHIIIHGERNEIMTADEVKKNFAGQNTRFIRWRSAQRSIDPIKDFLALSELYKVLSRLKRKNMVDAVHLHSSKSGLLGRAACRMAGISNVFYTPNGASFLSAKTKLTKYIYRQLEKIGHSFGGKVVCCSASELEEFFKLGIDAVYINNGIDVNDIPPVRKKQKDKFRIITSGRIEAQKNPALFNSIASYFEEIGQFEFIWIGDGTDKKMFTAKNIIVTGWLNNKEVHQYVASSDVYLSTSLYEGLSFAVLEALAFKKPVLLSNCTGNRDLVKNGINGNLFNTGSDAIVKILQYYNNRDMLGVMGNFSGQICRTEFDVKQNFKNYRDLYARSKSEIPMSGIRWKFGY
jgi:glycosyltransferase involved in cell wall biosynthesis